jgi:hypothetical protein
MNNTPHKEDHSLIEVREWKEQCRRETEHLNPEEYLAWIRTNTEDMIAKYHLKLQVVNR